MKAKSIWQKEEKIRRGKGEHAKKCEWELHSSPVVRTMHFHCQEPRFDPTSHEAWRRKKNMSKMHKIQRLTDLKKTYF